MNSRARQNLFFHIGSGLLLLLPLAALVFSLVQIFLLNPEEIILDVIALSLTICFVLLEVILMFKGGKKESNLFKIAYNENNHVNTVPLIAVGVGTLFGIGLLVVSIIAYFSRDDIKIQTSMLIIFSIALYLFINCLIYFIYVIAFRKKELKLEDLIK